MKNKIYLVLILIVFMWGCGDIYYYDLYMEPQKDLISIKIPKILFVEDMETNEAFWHQRIAYRSSPYKIKYLTFKQWATRPSELIKDSTIRFYRNSSLFKRVIKEYSKVEPDLRMKINIDALEMYYREKNWYAHLALDIEIFDAKSEKMILTHSFNRKKKLKGKKARYLPEKISEILQEELLKVVKKLNLIQI
ncbi:MAG: ABC-type transport auxiliary lipoprotein family protein [Acidobacteriota bacterium]